MAPSELWLPSRGCVHRFSDIKFGDTPCPRCSQFSKLRDVGAREQAIATHATSLMRPTRRQSGSRRRCKGPTRLGFRAVALGKDGRPGELIGTFNPKIAETPLITQRDAIGPTHSPRSDGHVRTDPQRAFGVHVPDTQDLAQMVVAAQLRSSALCKTITIHIGLRCPNFIQSADALGDSS